MLMSEGQGILEVADTIKKHEQIEEVVKQEQPLPSEKVEQKTVIYDS